MPETLYLTCNIIDRYLSIRNVSRKRLQLVRALSLKRLSSNFTCMHLSPPTHMP